MDSYKAEELVAAIEKIARAIAHPHQLARISEAELEEARVALRKQLEDLAEVPDYNPDA